MVDGEYIVGLRVAAGKIVSRKDAKTRRRQVLPMAISPERGDIKLNDPRSALDAEPRVVRSVLITLGSGSSPEHICAYSIKYHHSFIDRCTVKQFEKLTETSPPDQPLRAFASLREIKNREALTSFSMASHSA